MDRYCHDCQTELARIHGRTLKQALAFTRANHTFGKITATQWVEICPLCDAYALGMETNHPWPFLCADGVMRTAEDFDPTTQQPGTESLDFYGLGLTRSALDSAIELAQQEFEGTRRLEDIGATFLNGNPAMTSLDFSQAVCEWGKGPRVWGNLTRHYRLPDLERALDNWMAFAAATDDADSAIAPGVAIKGLNVSFASKHLRMLDPQRYAVLDEVISQGLGFAMNPAGYALFLRCLQEFLARQGLPYSVATLESGLFYLIRQSVRARDGQPA
ncbi:hypothetical protein [Modicisalibacter luteus]|uniref:Uncharacterized protein n=1 Tax=Modicisalibacter luteus TaxID=453962 RepID=A0ABV7M637_9GAMM|nr:hypothetical protein [Halomonas lutea]GHB07960.1 hypothetical protein GCM10007159_32500 [Halomonas lutea]